MPNFFMHFLGRKAQWSRRLIRSENIRERIHLQAWPTVSRLADVGARSLVAPTAGGSIASGLFKPDSYAANCSRHFGANLGAAKLQDYAVGILQLNPCCPGRNRTASSDRAVTAFKRSQVVQIEGPSNQLGCRGSDRKADIHARNGKWIALSFEGKYAFATADPDDESPFCEHDGNLAGFGPRWRAKTSYANKHPTRAAFMQKFFMTFSFEGDLRRQLHTAAASPKKHLTRRAKLIGLGLSRNQVPKSINDVIAAVDVEHAAGDELGAIQGKKRGRLADVVDADEAACRRLRLRLVHQFVELRNT